jgi:AraC family transcriptional regulator
MGQELLAVSAGATHVRRMDVTLGLVSSMRFSPDVSLERHRHPQATVAIVLAGGFAGTYRSGERDCAARSVIVEPAGELHGNRFGRAETTILSLSLRADRLGPAVEAAAGRFRHGRDAFAELIARRAARELDRPDDVTPLAVEAAALELMARIARTARHEGRPAWLAEARDFLHDRYADSLSLVEVAEAVGVEPERLARAFRRTFGEPLAGYLRRIRVEAAAQILAATDLPISRVAGDVGFADQSHLTRWFGRYLDTTPARYRARHASRCRGGTLSRP